MLLNLWARMNAISAKFDAQWNLMQNHMSMMNAIDNLPFLGSNLSILHSMDRQFALNNLRYSFAYQVACAQEKAAEKRIAQELSDNRFSTMV